MLMKQLSLPLFLFIFISSNLISAGCGISYTDEHVGRFGDCLKTYCEARWLAFKNNWEFYYHPFSYTDKLAMHTLFKHRKNHHFPHEVSIRDVRQIPDGSTDTLYIVDGFLANNDVNLENHKFMALVQAEVSPVVAIEEIAIPQDHYAIALHVRRGGGYDYALYQSDTLVHTQTNDVQATTDAQQKTYDDQRFPTRFPPDTFFIDQLKFVVEQVDPKKKIYVHLFTDDPLPSAIVEKYRRAINEPRVVFGYRITGNRLHENVLEDFFNIMRFDCLIRSASHFSEMAGAIGRIKLEIKPEQIRWEGRKLIVTTVKVIERDSKNTMIQYIVTDNKD